MRIGPLSFEAPICLAEESAPASCPVSLFWPIAWTAVPLEQPQPEAACICVPVWVTGAVFVAVAVDSASFSWLTEPSLPPEPIRTGSFVFDAPTWKAEDAEPASCPIVLDWSIDCTPGFVVHPHGEPTPVWLVVCVTGAVFCALAEDVASFDCDTEPPLPGLRTRTERFEFSGLTWVAEDRPIAFCVVSAFCVDDCTPEPPPVCVLPWVVVAVFVALAVEVALFDCDTAPSFPGLRTRTEMFELLGCTWVADEAAAAVWSVDACCCDDWTPPPAGADDCVAPCVVGAAFVDVPVDEASFDCVEPAGAGAAVGAAVAGAAGSVPAAACNAPPRICPTSPDSRPLTTQPQPDAWVWLAFCVVDAVFVAVAFEEASFDCETAPSSPGLSTRTEMFWFDG